MFELVHFDDAKRIKEYLDLLESPLYHAVVHIDPCLTGGWKRSRHYTRRFLEKRVSSLNLEDNSQIRAAEMYIFFKRDGAQQMWEMLFPARACEWPPYCGF